MSAIIYKFPAINRHRVQAANDVLVEAFPNVPDDEALSALLAEIDQAIASGCMERMSRCADAIEERDVKRA